MTRYREALPYCKVAFTISEKIDPDIHDLMRTGLKEIANDLGEEEFKKALNELTESC